MTGPRSESSRRHLSSLCLLVAGCATSAFVLSACDESTDPAGAVIQSRQSGRNIANSIDMKSISDAIRMFELSCERLPTDAEGLSVLFSEDNIDPTARIRGMWTGPYLPNRSFILDTYDNEIVYQRISDRAYKLISYGEDNEPGGTGRSQDVEHEVHL